MGEGADVDVDEDGQEIIPRGVWTQAANGDTTYYPGHVRPRRLVGEPYEGWHETAPYLDGGEASADAEDAASDEAAADAFWDHPDAPARGDPRGGYRIRSPTVWGQAQADYLAGDSAPAICDRYDLSLGAFRSRAAREGWRRRDATDACVDEAARDPGSDPEVDAAPEPVHEPEPDLARMADDVLVRARRAIARGRAAEAATWLRVHRQLTRLAPPPEPEPSPEPEPAPAPDPGKLMGLKMKAVAEVARAAAGLNPDNAHGQAAIGRLLDELKTLPPAWASPPISDDSDDSDCEFSAPAEVGGPPPDD